MTLIDWSDPDEMFGLLCEYVADEARGAENDTARSRFLAELGEDLEELSERFGVMSQDEAITELRAVHRSQPVEFAEDTVLSHVLDCIEELERISKDRSG